MSATSAAPVPLVLAAEHEELRAVVRAFLEDVSPESAVRAVMETDTGFAPAVWARASNELGLAGLMIPEEYGGAGFGFVEMSVVLEEAGRALLPAPLLSSAVLTVTALLASDDADAQQEYLPGLASGEIRGAVALPRDADSVTATDGRLSGTAGFVIDGHSADLLIVATTDPAGPSLWAVEASANGLTRTSLSTLDQTRKLATLTFDGTPARLLGSLGGAAGPLERVHAIAAVALACEQVGGAQRILDVTVDYVRSRNQFGRAIGSFQAVKHRCADMLVDVESARSVALYAAHVATQGSAADLQEAAAMAKAFCSDAYVACAEAAIQLHGGIGFTWEYIAHLHLKRAKSGQLLFGDPVHHRQVLAGILGL